LERIGTFLARLKRPQATRNGAIAAVVLIICTWLVVATTTRAPHANGEEQTSTQGRRENGLYYPAPKQWESLTTVPVSPVVFRSEHMTEGKIAIDEDRSTLVFSPYSGRVIKLLAKPGDMVKAGQPLFTVEAPDMVQAQNDFIASISNLNKAKSALELAKIVEQQNKTLFDSRAGPLRDLDARQPAAPP
jgi:cobalt-zinc-cadmium efflux system membrane fusion protein